MTNLTKSIELKTALAWAESIDAFRVVPRLILLAYAFLVYSVIEWFFTLQDPTGGQVTFVTIITGMAAVVIGLYQNSGRKWGPDDTSIQK